MDKPFEQPFGLHPDTAGKDPHRMTLAVTALTFVAVALGLGVLSLRLFDLGVSYLAVTILLVLGFGAMGGIFVQRMHRRTKNRGSAPGEGLLYGVLLAAAFLVILYLFFNWGEKSLLYLPLPSACAFLLPYCVAEAFRYFSAVPGESGRLWQYGDGGEEELPAFLFCVKVNFSVQPDDPYAQRMIYSANMPPEIKVGAAFRFTIDQHKKDPDQAITYQDREGRNYGWAFYLEKNGSSLHRQRLDPDKNIRDYGIERNDQIIAERAEA